MRREEKHFHRQTALSESPPLSLLSQMYPTHPMRREGGGGGGGEGERRRREWGRERREWGEGEEGGEGDI